MNRRNGIQESKNTELALLPYYLLVRENGYLKAQADIFGNEKREMKILKGGMKNEN